MVATKPAASTPAREGHIALEIVALAGLDLMNYAPVAEGHRARCSKGSRTEMLRQATRLRDVGGSLRWSASLKRQLRDLAKAAREDRFDEGFGTTHLNGRIFTPVLVLRTRG